MLICRSRIYSLKSLSETENRESFCLRFQLFSLLLTLHMETREQIEHIERFLKEVVVNEIGKLQGMGLTYIHFVVMGQAVEVLGGFLDNKPLKARGQSHRRFSLSVNKLFGGRYRLLNENLYLYDKLRNQMVHSFLPSGDLLLLNRGDNVNGYKHLDKVDGRVVLIAEDFCEDIYRAVDRLLEALRDGRLKPKNIAY